ncbi:unnamed protein product, partial [Scytosiphon promiscuus]
MDRRIVFVAEPGPLVGVCETAWQELGRHAAAGLERKVWLDLQHLRSEIDDLSSFCRRVHQQENATGTVSAPIPKTSALATNAKSAGLLSLPMFRNQQQQQSQADAAAADRNAGSGVSGSGRSILLAAVFPCPDPWIEPGEATAAGRDGDGDDDDDCSEWRRW